ncbi:hypothetical protein [Nitratireductor sp. XY-223]|uniref:hypothetical protein n=1 Tax=Nitratireductor sp. XY-223 TaxID=2561926 RepID=UPI0010AA3F1A|nr:hypothetical protein [Nitratireductor sp. XY-223]
MCISVVRRTAVVAASAILISTALAGTAHSGTCTILQKPYSTAQYAADSCYNYEFDYVYSSGPTSAAVPWGWSSVKLWQSNSPSQCAALSADFGLKRALYEGSRHLCWHLYLNGAYNRSSQ